MAELGRTRRTRNAVWGNPSWVRIPLSPPHRQLLSQPHSLTLWPVQSHTRGASLVTRPLRQGPPGGEAGAAAGPMTVPGGVAQAADRTARGVGPMELQETNEMTAPMDDYKQAAEEEEFKAKRSQSKSKIRTARANATVAKTRADEAEAKASRSEAESGAKIAHMLEKLDREIVELTAHSNPKVSSVLSRLEKAIDSKHKVPATKK